MPAVGYKDPYEAGPTMDKREAGWTKVALNLDQLTACRALDEQGKPMRQL